MNHIDQIVQGYETIISHMIANMITDYLAYIRQFKSLDGIAPSFHQTYITQVVDNLFAEIKTFPEVQVLTPVTYKGIQYSNEGQLINNLLNAYAYNNLHMFYSQPGRILHEFRDGRQP